MYFFKPLFIVLLPLALSSCLSRITVKKINNSDVNAGSKAKGVRYSLPQPFVIGTPQLNGKVSYRVEYLPDPDNEYAVNTWSFMAKHKMKLTRSSNGMLKMVAYTQDDSTVAASMVDTAGNLGEAQIKAMAAAAAKKPSGADASARDGEGEAPHVSTSAAGPVIYRVVEDPRFGVRLEPVKFKVTLNGGALKPEEQRRFETTGSPADAPAAPAPATGKPALVSPATVTLKKDDFKGKDPFFTVTFNMKVNSEGLTLTEISGNKDRTSECSIELANSDKAVVTLKKAELATGKYTLSLAVSSAKDKNQMAKLPITLQLDN